MPDLIDREKLLRDGIRVSCGYNDYGLMFIPLRDVKKSIKNAPSVDAEPIRHGRWDENHGCTVCKVKCVHMTSSVGVQVYIETSYCPSCGAKMDAQASEHH